MTSAPATNPVGRHRGSTQWVDNNSPMWGEYQRLIATMRVGGPRIRMQRRHLDGVHDRRYQASARISRTSAGPLIGLGFASTGG